MGLMVLLCRGSGEQADARYAVDFGRGIPVAPLSQRATKTHAPQESDLLDHLVGAQQE